MSDPGLPSPPEEQGAENDDENGYDGDAEDEGLGGVIGEYLEWELRDLVENTRLNQGANEVDNGQGGRREEDNWDIQKENGGIYHAMKMDSEALEI